jgi:hypothetical protein
MEAIKMTNKPMRHCPNLEKGLKNDISCFASYNKEYRFSPPLLSALTHCLNFSKSMKRSSPVEKDIGGFYFWFTNEIVLITDVGVLNNVLFISTKICV